MKVISHKSKSPPITGANSFRAEFGTMGPPFTAISIVVKADPQIIDTIQQ